MKMQFYCQNNYDSKFNKGKLRQIFGTKIFFKKSSNTGLKTLIYSQLIEEPYSFKLKEQESKQKTNKFDTAYSKLSEIKLVTIGIASPDKIRQWAEKTLPNGKIIGQVLNANTLHHKSFKPQKGGLFCERIFGPLKDFECACGKVQKPTKAEKEKLITNSTSIPIPTFGLQTRKYCPICDVEYTWSVIRRYQLGYIQLVSPVTHIWYLKGNPSYLSILLDMKKRYLEYVTYCTESLTIENALKGNISRLTNNPSEILAAWTKLVQKEKQNYNMINISNLDAEKFKKSQLKKEKRILKQPKISNSWLFLGFDESNNIFKESSSLNLKKLQLKILTSFISKEVNECLTLDLKTQISNENLIEKITLLQNQKTIKIIYKKISIKRVLKKFPTCYYLFFNLQILSHKKLLKLLMLQIWTKIYLNAINTSLKNVYFFKIFTNLNLFSDNLYASEQKMNNLIEKGQKVIISPEKLVLVEKFQIKWFELYLDLLNRIKPKTLIKIINVFVQTDFLTTPQKTEEVVVNIINILMPNSKKSILKSNLALKYSNRLENYCQILFHGLRLGPIKKTINQIIYTLYKLIFLFLIEEKMNSTSASSFGDNEFLKNNLLNNQRNYNLNEIKSLTLSKLMTEKVVSFSKKLIKQLNSYKINLKHLNKLSNILDSGISIFPFNISSTFWKKESIFLGEYEVNQIYSSILNPSRSTINYQLTSFSQNTKTIKSNSFNKQKKQENEKKLVNNFYTVSHRERWIDSEWQNFVDYMSVSSTFSTQVDESTKNLISDSEMSIKNLNKQSNKFVSFDNIDSLGETLTLTIIPEYKNRIYNLNLDPIFALSSSGNEIHNNFSYFSGPGIIQQLLKELDFSEQRKMDKQNRILLYQLNKDIFMLKKQIYKKSAKKELKDCYKYRDQLIRRTKLIRTFFRKDSNPQSMILTILPVLPPDLRPIVKIGGQIAASDLNRLYQRVIYRNDRLKKFLKDPATSSSYEMKYAQRLLQESVDNLIQNGKSGVASEKDARGRALKSLSDLLKGKQGRFRQYLLGKRVDYSGRSVIVVGPKLKLHECGLPKEMALELYLPFLLKRILNHNYARTVVGAKTLIQKNPELTWELLKEIMQTCPVLLNRAPTLHRLGIQAFQPKLIEGRAILLHPLVCPAFNADFDGDQMAVHVPITVEARAEAWKLMCARNNFLSPATGEPLAIPSQDMVLGCYYLTTNCNKSNIKMQRGTSFAFSNFTDVLNAYNRQIIDLHAILWVKFDGNLEQGNDKDEPLEIRINSFGQWNEIYKLNQRNYSNKNLLINQYICTTPGRILFNFIIQNTQVSNLFH